MKLQALMIAVALAAGTAYAQAPNGSAKAPADTQSSAATMNSGSQAGSSAGSTADTHKTAKSHRKVAKKMSHHANKEHASLRRHENMASARRHEMHARAERREMHASRMSTRTLGAGPSVNLNSRSREERMDRAYEDFRAKASR